MFIIYLVLPASFLGTSTKQFTVYSSRSIWLVLQLRLFIFLFVVSIYLLLCVLSWILTKHPLFRFLLYVWRLPFSQINCLTNLYQNPHINMFEFIPTQVGAHERGWLWLMRWFRIITSKIISSMPSAVVLAKEE